MPDPTPDLVSLADQVKFLSEDLNRRFELLNSRIDALSLTHKVTFTFAAALDGEWVGGTTTPQVALPAEANEGAEEFLVARGQMSLNFPNLSRIAVVRGSVLLTDVRTHGGASVAAFVSEETRLLVSLQRTVVNANISEPVVQLFDPPDLSHFRPFDSESQGFPIAGKEFVDNDSFKYSHRRSVPNSFPYIRTRGHPARNDRVESNSDRLRHRVKSLRAGEEKELSVRKNRDNHARPNTRPCRPGRPG
jgi:hypothetical protein